LPDKDNKRERAFELWCESDYKKTNAEIAAELDVSRKLISAWKQRDKWAEKVGNGNTVSANQTATTKRKRGGQPGNTNARQHGGKELGAEYYETSAHAGARPTHAVWQGKVFKINGSTAEYPNFYESTGYGKIDGLCGVNCRHSFYPFFPGISQPAYTKAELDRLNEAKYTVNGQKLTEYEVSQLMRKSERAIRATKRKIIGYQAAMEAADNPRLKADLQADCEAESMKLHRQQAQYNDLCKQTDHKPDFARTGVAAVKDGSGQIVSWDYSASKQYEKTYERVDNTAEMRYNNGSAEQKLDRYIADEQLKKVLRSDKTVKTILIGKQEKHIIASNNYIPGRSYITVSSEEVQQLVNQYAGTGDIKRTNANVFNRREVCIADRVIGVVVDLNTGKEYHTRKFTIHYANNGIHIVPAKED